MDTEGLGRKLLLTPRWWPPQSPWKADRGYCDSISQNANPTSTFELSRCRQCKVRAACAEERFLGALRQSVPQNGRVHLHIIEIALPPVRLVYWGRLWDWECSWTFSLDRAAQGFFPFRKVLWSDNSSTPLPKSSHNKSSGSTNM